MYLGQNIKQILPGNVAVGGANMGMVPLFSVQWCPSRAAIWAGYVPADGQELDNNLFPDAAAGIAANNVPTTSGSNWLVDPTARGAYVEESSPGMFRLPDLNGKSSGSLGAVFLRGDGAKSGGVNGLIQEDAFKSHSHDLPTGDNGNLTLGTTLAPTNAGNDSWKIDGANFTGGSETRPLNVTGCWVIKLFGAVTNMASADAAQLASSYASLDARIDQLEMTESLPLGVGQTWQDVTWIRGRGTTYTNTTGRPIQILVQYHDIGDYMGATFTVGSLTRTTGDLGGGSSYPYWFSAVIPNGNTYSISGGVSLPAWWELR